MVFIAILLALALERFFDWGHLRRFEWFDQFSLMLAPHIDRLNPKVRMAACILPPVLLVGLIEYILAGWLYGLLRFLFDFVILLYCFGPVNFWAQLYECLQAINQNDPQLSEARIKAAFPYISAATPQALHQAVVRAIFLDGHRRIFAVLFWFSVLGPMGALLYRLTALADSRATPELNAHSTKALEVLDWLPARLLAFLFGLGGHFVKVLALWKQYASQGLNSSDALISEAGVAALDYPPSKPFPESGEAEKLAVQLFDRALIIMLVFSAVLVLVVH
jgi:AmpE protein